MITVQEVKDSKSIVMRNIRKILKASSGKEVETATESKLMHAGRVLVLKNEIETLMKTQ